MTAMRNIPDAVKDSWPAPNYVNPQVRGPGGTIMIAVLLAVVLIVVTLRLYVRVRMKPWLGYDDMLIFFAAVSFDVLRCGYEK